MPVLRQTTAIAVAAASAAVLAVAQVEVAELAGITTLGGDFWAGEERVQGVQVTLISWYCAVSVPLAVAITNAWRVLGARVRLAAVPAALGVLVALPVVAQSSSDVIRDDAISAVLTGILLGVLGGLVVTAVPAIGRGLAVYVALLWIVALTFALSVPGTVVYAGMVEPLGLEFLRVLRSPVRALPYLGYLDYHLPFMLPLAVVVIILSGLLGATAMHRTAQWGKSVAVATVGPVSAAAVYWLNPGQLYLWNESAAIVVLAVALCCLLLAAVTASAVRGGSRLSADSSA